MQAKAWKGDLTGGIMSSIMGLPKAIPWGVLVFAPLGPAYAAMGAFAGLISIIFPNLGSAATRGAPILNSGPFSITTLMLASAVHLIINRAGLVQNDPATVELVIDLIFLTVFMSGLFQVLFGLLKIGSLAKYIPYPVIAGLMNGAGISIFIAQVRPMTGLGDEIPLHDMAAVLHNLSLPNLGLGILTLLLFWRGDLLTRRIPAAFLGIIIGTVIFHLAKMWGYGQSLGTTIGAVPGGIPTPEHLMDFLGILFRGERMNLVAELIPIALSIAIVNSLRSLIVVVAVDNLTYERTDSNKELIGQGIGNMLSGAFGGLSGAGSQSTTMAGFRNGASTVATKFYSGFFSLLVLVVLTPAVSFLPEVVLSASLMMMGIEALDLWSIKLMLHAFTKRESPQEYMVIFVVLTVAGISVFSGTTEALAVGIFLSVVHFIYRMGKDILAREYDATKIRSNIIRPLSEIKFLEAEGDRIRVLELQGALFFGTADKLAGIVDKILNQDGGRIQYIILNFRKVNEMDGSGGNLVGQIHNRCRKKGIQVWISTSDSQGMGQRIKALGVHDFVEGEDFFGSLNAALGRAEDKLLDAAFGVERNQVEKRLEEVTILSTFHRDELQILSACMKRECFPDATVVYRQGEAGDSLYCILKGRAKIVFSPPGSADRFIVAILCPGMIFGEMAIIDGSPRSAGIIAEGELICVSIDGASITSLQATHPEVINKLYQGFALNLTQQLRIANRINSELQA
ncbi:MAG: SulP family inorganic anion transporter [Sulfuricellaceae bacterium]